MAVKWENAIIAPEGLKLSIIFFLVALISFIGGYYIISGAVFLLFLFNLFFFRNPKRIPPEGPYIVAPADGEVILIKSIYEDRFFKGEVNLVSIFMSVFNVHINRAPYDGRIIDFKHFDGKFFSANLDNAFEENERNFVFIETPEGKKILYSQVAGLIARRIISEVRVGDYIRKGNIVGLICYGSRVDIFLPKEIRLKVKLKDKTKAGETIIGVIE
ncbi:MAG: phosphatidylserine decarboxylase family protein [Proteobacteria bacterium]|nr:phosphatidylserine decarboxylase family protein [Pseudomonadota bacterium]